MDFTAWQTWKGAEVAAFICTFCDLPQYSTSIRQSLTGKSLVELTSARMLNKGLSLAGICNLDHQKIIAEAVVLLMESSPENLVQEFERLGGHLPTSPAKARSVQRPQPPSGPGPSQKRGRQPRVVVPEGGLLLPRVQRATEEALQTARLDVSHYSTDRRTPRPAEQYDFFNTPPEPMVMASGEVAPITLQLCERLGRTQAEYVAMREADNPSAPDSGIVFGLRAVQCLHAKRKVAD